MSENRFSTFSLLQLLHRFGMKCNTIVRTNEWLIRCVIVLPGAEFSRHVEVLFNPGNQRLSIVQTGHGLDEHNHLRVDTVVNGDVPLMPPGAEVTMEPFKEIYQYYPSGTQNTI